MRLMMPFRHRDLLVVKPIYSGDNRVEDYISHYNFNHGQWNFNGVAKIVPVIYSESAIQNF